VANELNNSINVIPDALTRTTSAGTGKVVTKDGFLKAPLGMLKTKNGNLVVANAQNGQLVEIDSQTGKQLGTYWADKDPAQQPPGSGDLFGIALNPEGNGIYFVRDDNNTLMEAVEK
jgi:DNA-binding beta-propeller fold protein YncE